MSKQAERIQKLALAVAIAVFAIIGSAAVAGLVLLWRFVLDV